MRCGWWVLLRCCRYTTTTTNDAEAARGQLGAAAPGAFHVAGPGGWLSKSIDDAVVDDDKIIHSFVVLDGAEGGAIEWR